MNVASFDWSIIEWHNFNIFQETLKRIVYKYGSVAVVIAVPNEMFVYGEFIIIFKNTKKNIQNV